MTQPPIPLFDVRLSDDDLRAVEETLRSGWLTMGPRTAEFEALFAEHLGVKHALATTNCTAALHLAYLAAGVGPGDEVIVPGITFVASAAAVRYCGATPVLADVCGPNDLSLDPADAADPAVWAISCFFIRSKARGRGITHRLVEGGIDFARQNGARLLEACPIDLSRDSRSIGLFVGSSRVFEKAGFERLVEHKAGRPLMRLVL